MAENKPSEIGRPPPVPDSQPANAGELLVELVRLVESSGFALKGSPPPVEIAPGDSLPASKPAEARETKPQPPPTAAPSTQPKKTVGVDGRPPEPSKPEPGHDRPSQNRHREDPRVVARGDAAIHGNGERPSISGLLPPGLDPGVAMTGPASADRAPDVLVSDRPNGNYPASGRRSRTWTFRASALVLVGLAVIGSTYALEHMASKSPETPPLASAAESPTPVQTPSRSGGASSDAAATAPGDVTPAAEETLAGREERPVDLTAPDSLISPPAPHDPGPATIGAAQPPAAPAHEPPAGMAAAPAVAEPIKAPQSPDPKGEPTASLPPEPGPAAAPTPTVTDSGPARAGAAPLPPARPTARPAAPAARIAPKAATKLGTPAKLSSQSGARAGAKAGANGPGAPDATTAPVAVAPPAAPPAQSPPAPQQPKANPVARAFGSVMGAVGAVAGLIPFAPH